MCVSVFVGHLCVSVLRDQRGKVSDLLELGFKWYKNWCWEQNPLLEEQPWNLLYGPDKPYIQNSEMHLPPVLGLKVPSLTA